MTCITMTPQKANAQSLGIRNNTSLYGELLYLDQVIDTLAPGDSVFANDIEIKNEQPIPLLVRMCFRDEKTGTLVYGGIVYEEFHVWNGILNAEWTIDSNSIYWHIMSDYNGEYFMYTDLACVKFNVPHEIHFPKVQQIIQPLYDKTPYDSVKIVFVNPYIDSGIVFCNRIGIGNLSGKGGVLVKTFPVSNNISTFSLMNYSKNGVLEEDSALLHCRMDSFVEHQLVFRVW